VKIRWTPAAAALARRYLRDQDGMRAIGAAVAALADDPYPPEAFHRGRYHRLRVGPYRIMYVIDGDIITVERVDRVADHQP
jgi:mRNA-degrading endonuclease RelE of RelBE toxin-antitoxin system